MIQALENILQEFQPDDQVRYSVPIETQRPPIDELIEVTRDGAQINLSVSDRAGADIIPIITRAAESITQSITGSAVGFNGGIGHILPPLQVKPSVVPQKSSNMLWLLIIPILYYIFKK